MPEQPDAAHARPEEADDATVAAVGTASEAFEYLIRARGHLYSWHQLMGHVDALMGEAADQLEAAGHGGLADELRRTHLGRNAIRDRWSFEVVEDFDATYYTSAEAWDRRLRDELMEGRPHVHEAEMKGERRADGPTDDR